MKDRYVVDPDYFDALEGMRFFSLKNSKGSSVIPTTKNFIGNYQIKKIQCDDAASCTVFPIGSLGMLRKLFDQYKSRCLYSIAPLRSVVGTTLALVLKSCDGSPIFDIRLGLDIFPERIKRELDESFAKGSALEPSTSTAAIDCSNCETFPPFETFKILNLFLCSDDISFLLESNNADFFRAIQKSSTSDLLVPYETRVLRRSSALLGKDFLGRDCSGSLHWDRVKFYMDTKVHKLQNCTWALMNEISESIMNKRYLKNGTVDFEVLDSIEPNDIIGKVDDLGQDLYDDILELF